MDVKILSGDEEEIEMRDLEDEEDAKQADGLALSGDEERKKQHLQTLNAM